MKKLLLILLITLLSIACTKGSGNSDNSDLTSNETSTSSFNSNCGVISGGQLQLPIEASKGFIGSVVVTGPDQATFTSGNTQILVKLQGIATSENETLNRSAINFLSNALKGQAIFFPADGECATTVTGGALARVGALFTTAGVSQNEALLNEGFAAVDTAIGCGSNLITTCYQALTEQGGSTEVVSDFLWKPVSERDGNLVVLLNPRNSRIVVNGVTLSDNGPSNGRGTTARTNRSGASFGSNITVQVFDELGRIIHFPGGADSFTIANGSQRVEFQ